MEHTAKHVVPRNGSSYQGMKQAAPYIIWEFEKRNWKILWTLELDIKNQCLLKQKTQGSVPFKTFTVPELIQKLPSLQPQGSSRRSISEAV
jgi:hypothetical protein